jgi:hypothetical protein
VAASRLLDPSPVCWFTAALDKNPETGDARARWAATLRVTKKGVWGRSPRRLVTEGGGGRNRLLSFFDDRQGRWSRHG